MMTEQNEIRSEYPDTHLWYTEIPNLVDEMRLDPYSFRLYAHLRRVAGEGGACWQSTETLAEYCQMSIGKISESKQVLRKNGLIFIDSGKRNGGTYHIITVIDIWKRNYGAFQEYKNRSRSPDERPHSQGEPPRSPDEPKKNPVKNTPLKNSATPSESVADAPPAEKPAKSSKSKTPEGVKVFRSKTHRYPAKEWYSDVEEVVGDDPADLERWGLTVKNWVGSGYNPCNVKGMLGCFIRGDDLTTRTHSSSNGRRSNLEATMENAERAIREYHAEHNV